MTEHEKRAIVRQAFGYRCAYCGVHENEVGSELEMGHFHPRAAGEASDLDNLVIAVRPAIESRVISGLFIRLLIGCFTH